MRKGTAMTKYFSQDTPLAGLERMMMSVPGFQKRGGGMMVLCRFHYKKEDVDCTYCRSYMRHTCQESVCPYIPERLEAGTIGYQELAERCLRMAGHQKLWKRASSLSKGNTLPLALEPAHRHRLSEWPEAGTASICPQKLAAVYLLSSRIGLWRRVLPHISHGRIDFSSVSLRGIDPRDYPVYRAAKGLYCGKLLITSAELADEEQVSSEAFGDILNAILLRLSPMEFTDGVFRRLTSRPKSLKDEINELTHRKKKSFLRREIADTQNILKMTGREAKFPAICAMSLLLFVVGASAAIMLGNFFLVPVLAVGMMFVPFWFIKLTASYYKKNIAAELETALSIITTAYLRNEDIQTAVEENLEYLNPPVKSVFAEFLARIQLVDPDVDAALQDMGTKIDNAVFREWVAALLACQHDRGLKTILTPIVAKLSDMRIVNGELENMVFEPRKEFIIMQVLVVGNIPLLYFLNRDWFNTLMHTAMGQIILAVCAGVIFVSTAFVIKLTQPIEYRR